MNCALVLLFWPMTGLIFGAVFGVTGIDEIAVKLREIPRTEVVKDVYNSDDRMLARARAQAYQCHIVLVGFSAGGNGAARVAAALAREAIPVALLVTFDPPDRPSHPLPPIHGNVALSYNIYQDWEFLGGGQIKRAPGNIVSYVVENYKSYQWHIRIASDERMQAIIVREVRRLTSGRVRR